MPFLKNQVGLVIPGKERRVAKVFCTGLPSGVLVATLESPRPERAGDGFTHRQGGGGSWQAQLPARPRPTCDPWLQTAAVLPAHTPQPDIKAHPSQYL